MACGRSLSASFGYHAEFHEGSYQKDNNPLNCRIRGSDISGYHANFHEGQKLSENGRGRHDIC
jgi:hypothetical protein